MKKMIIENPGNYKITQKFEETEKAYRITIEMKIPKTPQGQYYIDRMINKQESAIITELKAAEKEARTEYKEGKREKQLYTDIFKTKE